MKRIDIFCASQTATTSICLNMEQASSSSSSSATSLGGGPAIDRHNPIITDSRRIPKPLPPLPPQSPVTPKPQKLHHKKKTKKKIHFKENEDKSKKSDNSSLSKLDDDNIKNRKSWKCTKPGDFISPPGSTRYLLREKVFLDSLSSDLDPSKNLVLEETSSKSKDVKTEEFSDEKPPSSTHSPDQVVFLRVSLHCRGCERKLRKHLSRMEGVTSFNIDFAAKKVTVVGNVTPLGVLSSISKVKNAQLWNPTISSSSSSSSTPQSVHLSHSEFKNEFGAWIADKGVLV